MLSLNSFKNVSKGEENKHVNNVLTKNPLKNYRVDCRQKQKVLSLKIVHVDKFRLSFIRD